MVSRNFEQGVQNQNKHNWTRENGVKELKILNRIIRYTHEGIELEADLRLAELIVSQLGVENAQELTCPAADEIKRDDDEPLNQ